MVSGSGVHTKEPTPALPVPLALRRHRLPRFWLALTLGTVAVGVAGVYWWERQLPGRIEAAASAGRLEECLRFSDQLAALSWLPGRAPQQQGRCRRARAAQLWSQEQWAAALRLQRQLVNSPAAVPDDRRRLQQWQADLRKGALARFQAGDLDGALVLLAPLGEDRHADGSALGDNLRELWQRNQAQFERAGKLTAQSRWWEALDSLNRIDHPWWQARSQTIRAQVEKGIARLKGMEKEHDSHGSLPHTVPADRLDALVQKRIAAGVDEWKAFEDSCRELGGRVVEAGPETACQR